jgi:neurofibromin 1
MSNYCQRIGKQYLKAVLGPSFQWLMESTLSFEIDPNQVDNAEVIKQNIFNMNYLANKFFKAVLNSNDAIPFEVREIANVLQTAVLKRFPNSKHSAVGGFFFLRFVCPAVLAPEKFDFALTDEHSATLRRPLVLVAKILQQIANDQKFNEPHMEPLNELISKWTVKVHQFFDLLVQKDHAALHKERDHVLEQMRDPSELERSLLEKVELTSTLAVHRIVLEHVDELVARYADKEKELGYNPASELSELFDSMGPPPEPERAKSRAVSVAVKK